MINTSKFDQAVLRRYQESFLQHNKTARNVCEKLDPPPIDLNFNYQAVMENQGHHYARYLEILSRDRGYEGTRMTLKAWAIAHHIKEKIVMPGLLWDGRCQTIWKGMQIKKIRTLLNSAPDHLYERIGAAILLANDELDPSHEIARYFINWKASYLHKLDEIDSRMQCCAKTLKLRQDHLNAYEQVLKDAYSELRAELIMLYGLFESTKYLN